MAEMIVAATEEVRGLDRRAIEEYGMPGVILMENAGAGAARIALEMLGREGGRVLILCGRGNNGGDGYVIGRHLHNSGVEVEFWLATTVEKVDPTSDAGINLRIIQKMGLPVREITDTASVPDIAAGGYALLVDALLGTGLSGEVREPMRTLIERINASGVPVLAVDCPSGLDTDGGRVLGVAVKATRTATFAAAKKGFFVNNGPERVGKFDVVDIGIPRELLTALRKE
jgi:NAD(P)H-hydrate epimerase